MALLHRESVTAEESSIVQRHAQGCVEPLRGLEDPKLLLLVPTGVQLVPASPKLAERLYEKSSNSNEPPRHEANHRSVHERFSART